jgi:membrane protease YdiL (CAAX protease family)
MDQALKDPWLVGLANVVVFGSAATWIYIASQWWRYGNVLPWEPRRSVPWGSPATILAIAFALMAVSSALGPGVAEGADDPSAQRIAINILSLVALQLLMAGGFFALIAAFYGVSADDLGLPRSAHETLRDIALGVAACFAALLPVRIVQWLSMWLLGRHDELSQHPLIETLTNGGGESVGIMLLACLSAVVVAPICEEATFRLLLQGWLEKWEDRNSDDFKAANSSISEEGAATVFHDAGNADVAATNESDPAIANSSSAIRHSSLPPRPRHGVVGLPHGWLPVFVSSLVFGIAHFGYGPEPIPLFFFAVFLGYVYQRTHRILPCIIAHGLFNLVSMVALWRILVHAS